MRLDQDQFKLLRLLSIAFGARAKTQVVSMVM